MESENASTRRRFLSAVALPVFTDLSTTKTRPIGFPDDNKRMNIEITDFSFPKSVRIGEKFTAVIGYRNPSTVSVEIDVRYNICVNTPEEARERGNSCYKVDGFSKILEPEEGWSTTISPVIDSEVPEEYRVPGDRGQQFDISTDSDTVLGAGVEESLELLPPYNPQEQTKTVKQRETERRTETKDQPKKQTETIGRDDEEGLISSKMRDILTLMSASGVTLVTIYRIITRGDN